MKYFFPVLILLFSFTTAWATNVVDQRYINQLSKGGNISIKQAAQSIYNTGNTSQEVLDVAAEVLLLRYPSAVNADIDTLSWLCKAIGQSHNSRYYSTLLEVENSHSHRKLKKYARIALGQVEESTENQYKKGMVDLAALRTTESGQTSQAAPPVTVKSASQQPGKSDLKVIVVGMSMQEVYDLVGVPTATAVHQTGKAYNPFHFSKTDLARTIALYKGQGRVIFSHDGYSSISRVIEVVIDPQESGYP